MFTSLLGAMTAASYGGSQSLEPRAKAKLFTTAKMQVTIFKYVQIFSKIFIDFQPLSISLLSCHWELSPVMPSDPLNRQKIDPLRSDVIQSCN